MYNENMLSEDLIRNLRNNSAFQQFQIYMLEKISELDSINGIKDMTNEHAGETVKARLMALNILEEILSPVLDFKEKRDHTIQEIQAKKDLYGF